MKNLLKIAFAATIMCNSAFSAIADNKILAKYKGGEVKASQVQEQFKSIFEQNPSLKGKSFNDLDSKTQESFVRMYINMKLVDQEVKKQKIEDSKAFHEKLENFKKQLASTELVSKIITEKISDKMVEEEYEKLIKELNGKEEIKVRHLLVKTEKEAEAIKQRITKGEKFNDLAKKLSEDPGSKANGGELGYFVKGQLETNFEEAAFKLKKNEVSNPVKTQFGWHLIKLEDKRKVKLPSKEEGLNLVRAKLEKSAVESYIEELNTNADVKVLIDHTAITDEQK